MISKYLKLIAGLLIFFSLSSAFSLILQPLNNMYISSSSQMKITINVLPDSSNLLVAQGSLPLNTPLTVGTSGMVFSPAFSLGDYGMSFPYPYGLFTVVFNVTMDGYTINSSSCGGGLNGGCVLKLNSDGSISVNGSGAVSVPVSSNKVINCTMYFSKLNDFFLTCSEITK